MRRAHAAVGWLFFVVFLGTGVFMRLTFVAPEEDDAGMRMMYRSAHVYILLGALANVLLGLYANTAASGWRVTTHAIASTLVLLAPACFTAAFFFEPAPERLARPWTLAGVAAMLLGTILHAIAYRRPA